MANDTQQSGLDALPTKPKAAAQQSAEILAANPDSSDLLQKMQTRVNELISPWHGFQSALDDMVARARNNPEANLQQRAQQKLQEQQEIQNLGLGLANVDLIRKQLGNVSGLNTQIQGGGGQQAPMGADGQQAPMGGGQQSNYSEFTQEQKMALNLAARNPDPNVFQNMLKEFANTNAREKLSSGWQDIIQTPIYIPPTKEHPDGQVVKTFISKDDYKIYKDSGYKIIPPSILRGETLLDSKTVEHKANGGLVGLANGGQPSVDPTEDPQSSVAVSPGPTDAQLAQIRPQAPMQPQQPGMIENALSTILGISPAEAKTVPVTRDDTIQGELEKIGATGAQTRENQAQNASLESEKTQRKHAADLVAKLENNKDIYEEVRNQSKYIIDNARDHGNSFGYKEQTGPYSYLLAGVNALPYGSHIEPTFEKWKSKIEGQDEIDRRNTIDTFSKNLGLNYATDKFEGVARSVGPQLIRAGQDAKGLGLELPAFTNLINATLMQLNAERHADLAESWDNYRKQNKGKIPDPYDWMSSDEYKTVDKNYRNSLAKTMSELAVTPSENQNFGKDKNGNDIVIINGKPMRAKK